MNRNNLLRRWAKSWGRGVLGLLLLCGVCPQSAMAKFGIGGKVVTSLGGNNSARSIVMQPDGKLVLAGFASSTSHDFAIARFMGDGSLDASFDNDGKQPTVFGVGIFAEANSLIVQPDGRIVVAGWASPNNNDFALARLNADGSLDDSFGSGGKSMVDFSSGNDGARCLVIQPDGKLLVAGKSNSDFAIARLNGNGTLDTSFNGTGKVTTSFSAGDDNIYGVALQPDGKIIVAGVGNIGASSYFALAQYNSTGSLDTNFGSGGKVILNFNSNFDQAAGLVIQADGKIVVAGTSNGCFSLARFSDSGVLDSSFGISGKVTTLVLGAFYSLTGMTIQSDGKLVVTGWGPNSSSDKDFVLARYSTTGALDSTFDADGVVTTDIFTMDEALCVIVQPDRKLVVVGDSDLVSVDLVRYNSNGSLDTQDDSPLLMELKTTHALAGQTITLDIRGWDLEDVIGAQLRNGSGSVNGSNLNVSSTRITAQFTLPTAPGLYDLYLAKNSVNRTFHGVFTVQSAVAQPVQWQMADLNKAGDPIAGPCNLAIGDADRDGAPEIYVSNSDDRIYVYKKGVSWTTASLSAAGSGYFRDVMLADMDLDGWRELYGGNSHPWVFRYQWSGSAWNGNSISAYSGPLSHGVLLGGGLAAIHAFSGTTLMQIHLSGSNWFGTTVGQGGAALLCSISGDVNNDSFNEVYAAAADHKLYQFAWGMSWNQASLVYAGSTDMTSLIIGDVDHDGVNELYGSNGDGNIYQFKWNGTVWNTQMVANITANKIVVGDGDSDGQDELYAAGQDGHAYQIQLTGGTWLVTDLGGAGTPLLAVAAGDGDNTHQLKIYAVGANAHVYQFQAVSIPATPTPVVTPTPFMTSPSSIEIPSQFLKSFHNQINPNHHERAIIKWAQPHSGPATIRIYNSLGDEIVCLADHSNYITGEFHQIEWDGMARNGQAVGSGIYIVWLKTEGYEATCKIAVVK